MARLTPVAEFSGENMILEGKPVKERILEKLKQEINENNINAALAVILVGNDPASLSYVKVKEKVAQELGIDFHLYKFEVDASEAEIIDCIVFLNDDPDISGIIVQLPLPQGFHTQSILNLVSRGKDVDGFLGGFNPPTVLSILEIIKYYEITLEKKNIVLVGHGELVGKPLEKELIKMGYTPIICDSETEDLKDKLLSADIIISATGKNGLITPNMVKSEAVIIDAGTAEANGKMTGDITPEVQAKVASYSPVPGGVGPVTVAMLMKNVVEAAKNN